MGAVAAAIIGVVGKTTFGGTLGVTGTGGGLGERLGGESILSKSFWLMPGGRGSFDKLLVLKDISGLDGSAVLRVTRLLGVLNLAIAGEIGITGAEFGVGTVTTL